MVEECCKNCKYYMGMPTVHGEDGLCRRYPHGELKYKEDWCGEYQPKSQSGG